MHIIMGYCRRACYLILEKECWQLCREEQLSGWLLVVRGASQTPVDRGAFTVGIHGLNAKAEGGWRVEEMLLGSERRGEARQGGAIWVKKVNMCYQELTIGNNTEKPTTDEKEFVPGLGALNPRQDLGGLDH